MTRWKASAIHLALSISIAAVALTLMLTLWYAPPFFSAAGGQQVLLIMLGVDVTLGPLITLIIFNAGKSRTALRFDFAVIGILQLAALLYGTTVMFHGRPVFVVFIKNSFDLVLANQLSADDLSKTQPDLRQLPLTGPRYVYSELPSDLQARNAVVLSAFSGKDLPVLPQYYQTYAGHESAVAHAAQPLAELRRLNPQRAAEIDQLLRTTGWQEASTGFVPLRSKFEDMAVLVDKRDGNILQMLKMTPW